MAQRNQSGSKFRRNIMREVLADIDEDEIPIIPTPPRFPLNHFTSPPVLSPHFNNFNPRLRQHLTSPPLSPSICSNRPLVFRPPLRPSLQNRPTPFHNQSSQVLHHQTSSEAIQISTPYIHHQTSSQHIQQQTSTPYIRQQTSTPSNRQKSTPAVRQTSTPDCHQNTTQASPSTSNAIWTNAMESVLINIWSDHYDDLKIASNKRKTTIYDEMLRKLLAVFPVGHTQAQMKNKLRYLEKKYKDIKLRLCRTGEGGHSEITEEFTHFHDLDEFLGDRDANNPDRMTIATSEENERNENDDPNQNNRRKERKRKSKDDPLLDLIKDQIEEDRKFRNDIFKVMRENTNDMIQAGQNQTSELINALKDIFHN